MGNATPIKHEFVVWSSAVQKLETAKQAALAELNALFAALQGRAFRGEL